MARRLIFVVIGTAVAGVLLSGCQFPGATYVVDTTADTVDVAPGDGACADVAGMCSLRAALMEANASPDRDTIQLAPDTTYALLIPGAGDDGAATGDLDVTVGVVITGGPGTVVDAAGIDRAFDVHIAGDETVEVGQVSITGGAAPTGAAIRLDGSVDGHLNWDGGELTGNTATAGAVVEVDGPKAILRNVAIHANAGGQAGALAVHAGSALLANATITDNTATTGAGAVYADGGNAGLMAATVSANAGATAGALTQTGTATVGIQGTILDTPTAGTTCTGAITSFGYNIDAGTTCALAGPGDLSATDPHLGALADNGGPYPTQAIPADSPAIDAYPAGDFPDGCALITDARLGARPVGTACDIGAYEYVPLTVDSGTDTRDATPGDGTCDDGTGACTLRAAIDEANARPGTDRIIIDPAVTWVSLSLTGAEDLNAAGDLDVTDPIIVDAGGSIVSQTAPGERIFDLRASATLVDAKLLDGDAGAGKGGAVWIRSGELVVRSSLLAENKAGQGGAVAVAGSATATISDTSIIQNQAVDGGAIWLGNNNTADLVGVTIGQNRATGTGSAIYGSVTARATVTLSTIVGNDGDALAPYAASNGRVTLAGSIVDVPATDQACAPIAAGGVVAAGYNVISDTSCSGGTGPANARGVDPVLGPLTWDHGPAFTALPHPASAAIDRIPAGTPGLCDGTVPTDPRGGDRIAGDCDSGALERQPADRDCQGGLYVPGVDLSGCSLPSTDHSGDDLTDADVAGADLSNATLVGTTFAGADLTNADLSGADLTGANLSGADLAGADLTGAVLSGADLSGADLSSVVGLNATTGRCSVTWAGVVAPGLDLSGCDLSGADLSGAVLTGGDLSGADLTGANLSGAVLTGGDLTGAVLSGADLSGADLSSVVGLNATTGRCSAAWVGVVAPGLDLSGCDLSGADLSGAVLTSGDLTGTVLSGANLSGADLHRADLTGADLTGANATGADLRMVTGFTTTVGRCTATWNGATLHATGDFSYCDLAGADLSGTDLTSGTLADANLTGASLAGAVLRSTTLNRAVLVGADLTGADLTDASAMSADLTGVTGFATAIGRCTVYLYNVIAPGIDLSGCHQVAGEQADFSGGDLTNVTAGWFSSSDLRDVSASGMQVNQMVGSNAARIDLSGADLSNAQLGGTDFTDADLTGADIDGAQIATNVRLTGADLTGATGTPLLGTGLYAPTFGGTTCPTGVNSDSNGGNCDGQWLP